jgi:hypothetical protein
MAEREQKSRLFYEIQLSIDLIPWKKTLP